ncbi:SMP-30/gluconolactonase/LRE family protein [Ornithinibacillus californiensis]|uniref:hypothetical protein n=1 Tax=Ornithinibacillus californiensis TaxID=161536 RepID=UPI00064DB0A5|nr:hypothetical protein [Ornithinibacillus californiensis]
MQKVSYRARDFGIPINAEEARTSAICKNEEGEVRFVIAAKGFLIIINPNTSESLQINFPDGYVEYPFASFSSSNGTFYTGAGNMFLSVNPFTREIHYEYIHNGEEIVGFSFTEDKKGRIYFTTYPNCHLLRYDPSSKELHDFGSMDATEKYAGSIAVDERGWVYIGIGTERKNVIAYHLTLGTKITFVPEKSRSRGTGFVYTSGDGTIYGHWGAIDLRDTESASEWYYFYDGKAMPIEKSTKAPSLYTGVGFQKIHRNGNGGFRIEDYSLADQYVVYKDRNNRKQKVSVNYQSTGAQISTIFLGPDKLIYGTSMHPLQLFQLDCQTEKIHVSGAIPKGGRGEYCCLCFSRRENHWGCLCRRKDI